MRTGALLSTEMRNDDGSPKSNYKVGLTNQPFIRLSQLNASEEKNPNFSLSFMCSASSEKKVTVGLSCASSSSSTTYTLAALFDAPPTVTFSPRSNKITSGLSWLLQHCEMLFDLFFKCAWEDVCALCNEYSFRLPPSVKIF